MNGVVIVGSDSSFIQTKFTPKLNEHGIEVLDHWDWGEKNTRSLPDETKAVIIMSCETGKHLVQAAKKAAKDRDIPIAEVPRQMAKALPRLELIGLVTSTPTTKTTTAPAPTVTGSDEIVYDLARYVFMQDGVASENELLKRVRKLNPTLSDNEMVGLVQSGVAIYKQYFAPAVEWVEMYLLDDVDLTDAALIRTLKADHSFNLTDDDYKDVVARGRRKVFGHITLSDLPNDAWTKYARPGLLIRKIVESEHTIESMGEILIEDFVDYVSATDTLNGDAPEPIESVATFLGRYNGNPLGLSLLTIRAFRAVNSKIRILQGTLNAIYVRAFDKKLDTNMANAAAWYLNYTYRDRSEIPHLTREEFTNPTAIHNILASCENEAERQRLADRFSNIRRYFGLDPLNTEAPVEDTTVEVSDESVEVESTDASSVNTVTEDGIVEALRGMDPNVLLDVVARITGEDLRRVNADLLAQNANLVDDITALQSRFDKKNGQFCSMRARVGAMTQANNLLRSETEALTDEVASLTQTRDTLQKNLDEANAAYRDKIVNLTNTNEDLRGRLERQAVMVRQLQDELREANNAANTAGNTFVSDLEETVDSLRVENETLRSLLDAADDDTPATPINPAVVSGDITLRDLLNMGCGFTVTPPKG